MAARQLGQAKAICLYQAYTGFPRSVEKLTHTGIAPGRFKVNLDDGLRCRFQANTHGMKAEQNFG